MPPVIRRALPADAPLYLDLLQTTLGDSYPDRQVFNAEWIQAEFASKDQETWVAEEGKKLQACLTLLTPLAANATPIANAGRFLVRSGGETAAEQLLSQITASALKRDQMIVSRVLSSDSFQQSLHEKLGYVCVGCQPQKHQTKSRETALFYIRIDRPERYTRLTVSESLPQIQELASAVLGQFRLPKPSQVRDGAVGYPLQTEITFHDSGYEDYEMWQAHAQTVNPPVEISGTFNMGWGYLRTAPSSPFRAILTQRENTITAAMAYSFDPFDRCMRLVQGFALDELSTGSVLRQALKLAQETLAAVYVEIDILVTAPRLLKTAEQLGFVPVAYFPAFYQSEGGFADVVKLIKLNVVYNAETAPLTNSAKAIAALIDQNFQDQKVGVAIINLLRALPIFEGLGDGELRKMARLFTQKLYRPGEKVFSKGDSGNEAYVVMRGQIDIMLDSASAPLASISNGQIFGELAFLDGAARGAMAVAKQASIVLVIQRAAFNALTHQEPHLGMVVMRNIAIELSNRLRKTTAAIKK